MDEPHLAHAVRYVSLHPVQAKLVARVQDGKWSSVAAHLSERNDGLVTVAPVLERYGDFSTFLGQHIDEHQTFIDLRRVEVTGRPFSNEKWLEKLEKLTGRPLKPQKRGPKRNAML